MPSVIQSDKPEVVTVKLFESFHQGFGDSVNVRSGRAEGQPSINGQSRYNRVYGSLDARWPGEFRMGQKVTKTATNHDVPPVFAAQWTDTTGIYPAIYYLVGVKIMRIRFGAVTEIGTNALGSSNATSGMFDDDGSGVPYLYASFSGLSSGAKIRRMNRATTVTTSADVYAHLLLSLNGKAYRTITPASGFANCQVSVCPYGSDRFTVSNWGAGTTVGFAGTDINALVAVRNAAVAVKPEGIFAYNQSLDQWVNYTPAWRRFPHLNNGKNSFFLGDALVVPMGEGGAVIFDGNNVRPFDPGGLLATPNAATTVSQFTAVGAMRHWMVGATQAPGNSKLISAGTSLQFKYTVDDIAYTDGAANARDLDLTTAVTLPQNAALKVYIGWSRPFTAVHFATDDPNTTARTMTVKVGTAAGVYTSVGAKNTGFRDFTELAGAPLGQTGNIVLMVDPVASTGWIQTTIDGVTAYWMELSFSGAFDSTVSWLTCQLTPWQPSLDNTNFPLDGLDRSGNFPHLLYGRAGDNGAIWHDMFTLTEPDEIGQVIFSDVGGSSLNHSRNLIAIGRFAVWVAVIAADDRPGMEQAPFLHNVGLIEAPAFVPAPGKVVRLKAVRINGREFDPTVLSAHFYYAFDYGKRWSRFGGKVMRFPEQLEGHDQTKSVKGVRFRWAFGFFQSAASAVLTAPVVDSIDADFEVVTGATYRDTGERHLQTQPRI